jgi:hypothetical protein
MKPNTCSSPNFWSLLLDDAARCLRIDDAADRDVVAAFHEAFDQR